MAEHHGVLGWIKNGGKWTLLISSATLLVGLATFLSLYNFTQRNQTQDILDELVAQATAEAQAASSDRNALRFESVTVDRVEGRNVYWNRVICNDSDLTISAFIQERFIQQSGAEVAVEGTRTPLIEPGCEELAQPVITTLPAGVTPGEWQLSVLLAWTAGETTNYRQGTSEAFTVGE